MQRTHIIVFLLLLMSVFPSWAGDINSELFLAAKEGRTDTVKTLLDKGADINAKNSNGWTALMLATLGGCKNIVEVLVNKGADVNKKNNKGMTALMVAANKGLTPPPTVQALLDKMMSKSQGSVPSFMLEEVNGYKSIVMILLNKGADVNKKNNNGWTALMFAEFENHTGIVRLLKQHGATK